MWLTFLKTLLIVSSVGAFLPTVSAAENEDQETFRQIAHELIRGIDQSGGPVREVGKLDQAINFFKKRYSQGIGKKLRIAILPYTDETLPIPNEVAEEYNSRLLAQMQKLAGSRYHFLARETLKLLIKDMDDTGALEVAGGNPINALMKKAQDFDVLVTGTIRRDGPTVKLRYLATRIDGILSAVTEPRSLPYLAPKEVALSIKQAVEEASSHFIDLANDMKILVLGGIRYADSGAQPPFGRRMQDRLSHALQQGINNQITERKLTIASLKAKIFTKAGQRVDPKSLTDLGMVEGKGAYILSGNYWVLPESVEMKLRLRNPADHEISWVGRIRMEDIQGIGLKPDVGTSNVDYNDLIGPFEFHLTTDRGKNPKYKVGEYLNLIIRLDRDGWVYCFYRQSDSSLIQIFPNPEMASIEPHLDGEILHTIPGETIFPFKLKLTKPTGYEALKCFATSRNVTDELPVYLRGKRLETLPRGTEDRLPGIFADLMKVKVSQKTLVITVTAD